jgi:hypothetical protein
MKRKTASNSFILKLVGAVVATVLSGCAATGFTSAELIGEMPFNSVHYGP